MVYERQLTDEAEPELVRRAVGRVCQRHEALRTTVVAVRDDLDPLSPEYLWHGFENRVAEQPVVSFECAGLAGAAREAAGEPGWLPGIRTPPGELPVFRFQLIGRAGQRALRIITDHALCDRWSLFALQRDIERAYQQEAHCAPASDEAAYPFSSFAASMYSAWVAGGFGHQLAAVEKAVAALDMRPLPGTGDRAPGGSLIKSFVASLSAGSTSRFEMACARLESTRLAVAIALFARAVGAEFGWRRLAWMIPHANRSARSLNSVGLFADSRYLFTNVDASFETAVREISGHLRDGQAHVSPPAALVWAWPGARDTIRVIPRLAADVQINPRRGGSRRGKAAGIFVERPVTEAQGHDEDLITFSSPPSFPAQPDLRLACDFSQRHKFAVNFRVDHIHRAAARSVAERLLQEIKALPAGPG
jgi:hypothetical protein